MTRVPTLHFNAADLPEAERFEVWRSAVPVYDVSRLDAAPFEALVDAWFLGDMVVSTNLLPPLRFHRSKEKTADGSDQLSLNMLRRGTWTGNLDGRPMSAGPGQIVMFDLTHVTDVFSTGNDNITLRVTRAPLVAAAPQRNLHGFIFEGPIGRVLADHMMLLVRRLPDLQQSEAAAVTAATVGLIASCIASSAAPDEQVPDRDIETRHRVFRYVDANISKPDLTATTIGRQVGVSRSALYRAFEPLGGIAQYVRARRLEAAHVLLEDPTTQSRIAEIAGRFGFVSDAHFSRAFRSRYGYNPRRARGGKEHGLDALTTAVGSNATNLFKTWVEEIG